MMTRTKAVAMFVALALNVLCRPDGPTRCVVQGRIVGIAGPLRREKDEDLLPNQFIIRFDSSQRFDSDVALQEKAAKVAREMNGHVVHVYKHIFQGVAIQNSDSFKSIASKRGTIKLDSNGIESVKQVR
jgi:hypothetical protein